MSISDKLTYLKNTKDEIKDAITYKGVKVSDSDTFRSYADKIKSIPDGWKPDPLWWDIETIIKEDTRDFAGKYISLIYDFEDYSELELYEDGCVAIATSDGAFYRYEDYAEEEYVEHIWDRTKDKPSSEEGIGTRYIIYYHNTDLISCENILADYTSVYTIFKCNITKEAIPFSYSDWFYARAFLQSFDFVEGYNFSGIENFSYFCHQCYSLVKLPKYINTTGATNFSSFCRNCYSLLALPYLDTSQGENFSYFCYDAYSLTGLPDLDTGNGKTFASFCYACRALLKLPNTLDLSGATTISNFCRNTSQIIVANIILPPLAFTVFGTANEYVSRESLQFMADNAPVVTANQTLTLGFMNIERAGGEDGEIIQTFKNKGWQVN